MSFASSYEIELHEEKQHFVYFVGCKAPNSDEQCYVCRVVKKAGTEQCLDVCPSTSMINKNKECVGEDK